MSIEKAIIAIKQREALLKDSFECHRLVDGVGDKLSGLYLDRYSTVAIAHCLKKLDFDLKKLAQPLHNFGITTLYARQHTHVPTQSTKKEAKLIFGPIQEELAVTENRMKFKIRPRTALNPGLFLDTREIRSLLINSTRNEKVLNTFCYTGSLGIAAYMGGAEQVIQVDISRHALTWAKENFELNRPDNLDIGKMRFIEEDSASFMSREVRRIEKGAKQYDTIIIDPPSYSSSRGKTFSFDKNIEFLLNTSCRLLRKNGRIIVMTNLSSESYHSLSRRAAKILDQSGRKALTTQELKPPTADFRAHSGSINMRGIALQVE